MGCPKVWGIAPISMADVDAVLLDIGRPERKQGRVIATFREQEALLGTLKRVTELRAILRPAP